MKKLTTIFVSVLLAVIMTVMPAVQVTAASNNENGEQKYISELKIGVGKNASDAEKALEGYEILKDDNGNYVDLNQKAGGGTFSKGERVVYLGYKTTSSRYNAVTDLAVMSMKGGFSTEDYDYLMEQTYMKKQIIPFVEGFLATIKEYRENYNSKNAANKQRAQAIHAVLNKLTDDDCGGAGLGDLLLNETKYELGDDAYNKLADAEKNKHADILTIIAQANGKSTLMLEKLLTRAADTNENTWLDRMQKITYDDLVDETGLTPSKAKKELDKLYFDDAEKLLEKWDEFRELLLDYDHNVEVAENVDLEKANSVYEKINKLDESADNSEVAEAIVDYAELQLENADMTNRTQAAAIYDLLEGIKYLDGTLLDLFLMSKDDIEKDISVLYPIIASFSEGQRAGVEFLTIQEIFAVAITTSESYKDMDVNSIDETSVYEGVDRAIYAKGGVGLTSDARRSDAVADMMSDSESGITKTTLTLMAVTGVCAAASLVSFTTWGVTKLSATIMKNTADMFGKGISSKLIASRMKVQPDLIKVFAKAKKTGGDTFESVQNYAAQYAEKVAPRASISGTLALGCAVIAIILVGLTVYSSYQDMKNHYKVDFIPIPNYMIDEKDLIDYNSKNEMIVLKNQSAYYKAILCNRTDKDEMYGTLGEVGDLNGDVGQQWLALYAERNDLNQPILADSFKVIVNSTEIPAGYKTGIHFFGITAAENLNNPLYVWNSSAPRVYVYFKTEKAEASGTNTSDSDTSSGAEGSSFTAGYLALAGGAGLLLGAVITAVCMTVARKKKKEKSKSE